MVGITTRRCNCFHGVFAGTDKSTGMLDSEVDEDVVWRFFGVFFETSTEVKRRYIGHCRKFLKRITLAWILLHHVTYRRYCLACVLLFPRVFYFFIDHPGCQLPTEPGWELYDLQKDPEETTNVYAEPSCADYCRMKGWILPLDFYLRDNRAVPGSCNNYIPACHTTYRHCEMEVRSGCSPESMSGQPGLIAVGYLHRLCEGG